MERVNTSMIYLIYGKNFYKCNNVSPPSTIIKDGIFSLAIESAASTALIISRTPICMEEMTNHD
jgi:hypothetical protein